jgi:diacylglycerol kinase family enzyme
MSYKRIDTIRINDQYSVNCIGIGFDAFVAYHFSKLPKRGLKTYISTTLKQFNNYHRQFYKIDFDGKIFEDKAAIITFANSSQWGNNFYIASEADIADGKIDVTIIKHLNYRNILQLAYRLVSRTIHKSSQAITFKVEKINMFLDENTPMHIDGEPMLVRDEFRIEIVPHSLNILCAL